MPDGSGPAASHDAPMTETAAPTTPGAELVEALASGDHDRAAGLLAPDVALAALVPSKLIEKQGRDAVAAVLCGWFPQGATRLLACDTGAVGERGAVRYRVRFEDPKDGAQVFEQQAYYDSGEAGITRLRLVCSGDHAVADD